MSEWLTYMHENIKDTVQLGLVLRLLLVTSCIAVAYLAQLRFSLIIITILLSLTYIAAYTKNCNKCKEVLSVVKCRLHATKWKQFKITYIKKISKDTSIYTFNLAYPDDNINLPLGHHIQLRAKINSKQVVRYYTPIFPRESTNELQLMIKSYPNGTMSKYLSTLTIGHTIDIRGPFGNPSLNSDAYPLQKEIESYRDALINKHRTSHSHGEEILTQLGIVAGGSGITPVLQVLHEIVTNPYHLEKISLIYANETIDDILLKQELDKMAEKHPHFQIHYVLNHPPRKWKGESGYITKRMLQKYLPSHDKQHKLLICGPLEMNELVLRYSKELGWTKGFQKSKSNDKVFVF